MDEHETHTAYMDKTDFDVVRRLASDGFSAHLSLDGKRQDACVDECDLVEVEIRLRRVVQEGNGSTT